MTIKIIAKVLPFTMPNNAFNAHVTSESKKPRQIAVVIYYCDLSRFFDSDVKLVST